MEVRPCVGSEALTLLITGELDSLWHELGGSAVAA